MPGRLDLDACVDRALEHWARDPCSLLQILREVQESLDYLPPAALSRVARALGLPLARVLGVAGFYSFLDTEPRGRYRVLFADNITDRMLGSVPLMEEMCRRLWVERERVSADGLVSVDITSCTGLCDQGPAMLVNGRAIPGLTLARVAEVCHLIQERRALADWPRQLFQIEDNVRRADVLLNAALEPGAVTRAALCRGPEATLDEIRRSNLRGRGGAGFATGVKWEACRNAPGATRYVVCNADEGEPGTFKDRVLLSRHADLVLEGMTAAAYVIGASKGLVYLRGEYSYLVASLEETLSRRRAQGLLGQGICGQSGFDFDIAVHMGAGSYVCGEESALLESLEGKRGIPRNRPPYPVTHGYLGQPTVVNNVETLCAAALIALRGGDWYRTTGTSRSAGTKLLSVSGDCTRPGIYEYPFGTTVAEVLDACGAGSPQAVQISGPSGTCIDAGEFGRHIAFEDLPTAGAFMVFDFSRDMFEVARNFAHFFAHESCGFCTPCRVGTSMLVGIMDKIHAGHGSPYDLRELTRLNRVLQLAAHCGLGHTACNPTLDTLKRFRPAYERRLKSLEFAPAFDLDGALATARQMTGRDDAGAHLGAGR